MKSKKNERIDYDWYGFSGNWHRMNGPAYIEYVTPKKKKIFKISYYLYNRQFYPWWVR